MGLILATLSATVKYESDNDGCNFRVHLSPTYLISVLYNFCLSGTHVDTKQDMLVGRGGEYRPLGSGRGKHYSSDNGECYV